MLGRRRHARHRPGERDWALRDKLLALARCSRLLVLDYWHYWAHLPQVAEAMLPTSPFGEATATLDAAERAEIAHEMQMIEYTQGGCIICYFPPEIGGRAKNTGEVVPSRTRLTLSNYGFQGLRLT
ncbi:MAG: hypothetical protein M0T79_07985 [Actinomycetota bacterium]|nr:hypothetical protein [Actinomycetota bacterium]